MADNGIVRAQHEAVHRPPEPALAEKECATTPPYAIGRAAQDAVHQSPEPALSAEKPGASQPHWGLWLYAIGLSILLLGVLFCLFLNIPQVPEHKPPLSANGTAETALAAKEEEVRFNAIRLLFVMTMAMTLCCGALGGCLFDMRGLTKHALEKNFDMAYKSAYILQPFAGALRIVREIAVAFFPELTFQPLAIRGSGGSTATVNNWPVLSGFIVFLVLVGGLFSMEVQPPHNSTGELDWIILRRQLPFMAFATLAGYSSHVFMMKLKDIAEVIFSIPERVNPVTKTNEKPLGGTAH